MSIHIVADKNSIADTVLLPGDPLRAKHIAQTYLTDVVQYNEIRGMYGFTGRYHGQRVSVQGTGMGMPSFSIYAQELIDSYGAKRLVRVGTCGTMSESLKLKDVLIVQGADSDSGMNVSRFGTYQFAPTATFSLLMRAYENVKKMGIGYAVGNVFTSDQFYDMKGDEKKAIAQSVGTMAVDMETCELYTLAHLKGIEALTLLTVSDSLLSGNQIAPKDRQTTFDSMVDLALQTLFD
ncbi:purine-nucleoside phosphorylase [Sphaerochaeta halotolerans]|jgi:purine-nucleoside phosphorylase|uniref:Uridine phosphorylase n=1 Tax=Sphaerochaeta halotolerans TaxID=2293840 RepID=A0A372MDF6_9SPIR|nr:purine-nucleoside phosphorylase [Sphaerochaeta halotolerans]MBG0766859.1 purine-nucleoside phosphorylase [Spirochaetaceae bacterium]MDK2858972.1 purine-nucleoside phosphorylase [Sphaerochaeta sp.]MDN5333208.1 purine-nucleoside phosphorylase [Sphaerochaeta sp.]MXI86326.1 purine-nucleoside phosphorylase [Sphaerochaeta halotolerans]RFU93829.1 purine-nucleoside phosphorylase [Sphaerochaeta halotolerans]